MPGLANMQSAPMQTAVKREDDEQDDFSHDDDAQEDKTTFKPRPQLRQPGTFMRSLDFFIKGMEDNIINVEPEYQREVVWTADRMTGLIDSLMENYYIPPVILNKKPQPVENGSKPRHTLVCVDGKQRLSSVRCFVQGLIPCHDHRGEKWWFCDTPSSRRKKILPEEIQKQFLNKEFVSFEYADISPEQEEDLFARVQMGMQLTVAEKMRASTGPWQELARCYVTDFLAVYSLIKDRSRAKDFQLTLACFSQIIEVQHPTAANGIPSLKTSHTSLPKLLVNKGAVDDGLKSHLAGVWKTFQDLIELDPNTFTNVEKTLKGVQTFAPVEMVAVTVLISMYSETRNNRLLIGDIKALRDALRDVFVDLRMNTNVWKFIWDFLDKLEQIRGAVNGTTVNRRGNAMPVIRAPAPAASPTVVPTAAKRGRPTARFKSLTVLPGASKPVPVRTEHSAIPASNGQRSPKRQRTDIGPSSNPSPSSLPVLTVSSSTTFVPSLPAPPALGFSRTDPMVLDEAPKPAPFAANKLPLPAPATPVSVPRRPARIANSEPTKQKSRKTKSVDSNVPLSAVQKLAKTPLPAPPEARQNRISELNSYRAPVAPMGTMKPPDAITTPTSTASLSSNPMSPTKPSFFDGNSCLVSLPSRTVPTPSINLTSSSPKSLTIPAPGAHALPLFTASGPFRPPSQPVETIRTVSPVQARKPPPPRPASNPPKPSALPLPQYDGAIDLTDRDAEQERRDLLSSFKAAASATHQSRYPPVYVTMNRPAQTSSKVSQQAHNVSSSAMSSNPLKRPAQAQRQRLAAVDLTMEEEPEEYNNPYQRLKQRKQSLVASRF